MNWKDYITTDPAVLFGKPVIRNTRIPVELLLEKMAGGYSNDELLKAYPKITLNDLQACLLFAAASIKHEKVLAV